MKENRALSGGLCALGCEVLYGLSYLFTKRTADAASAAAGLAVYRRAGDDEPVRGAGAWSKIRLRGRRAFLAAARGALFCPCLFHRRNGGEFARRR